MTAASIVRHPVFWIAVVLTVLSILWTLIGAPISLITQIAIYTLYGAGVNLLVAYTGLVPFGASVAFILMTATLGLTASANILVQRRFRR